MADEIHRIEDQLRRAFAGEAWHGPALLELLDGLTAGEAAAHPIGGAHSVWEITLHLIGTYELVLRRLDGDDNAADAGSGLAAGTGRYAVKLAVYARRTADRERRSVAARPRLSR